MFAMKLDPDQPVKDYLSALISKRDTDMATVSRGIGKNTTYLFAYFTKGSPKKLPEDVRERLGEFFNVDAESFKTGISKSGTSFAQPRSATLSIEEVDVRASAGGGQLVDGDGHQRLGTWSLPAASFGNHINDVQNVRIIQVVGDSMLPDLYPGDRILVDISDRKPSPPGMFVIWDGMGLVVKRCEYIANSDPPRVRLSSSNKAYQAYELNLDECHINGRVIGKWQWT